MTENMDNSMILRINELARKAKAEGLTEEEKQEQADEYAVSAIVMSVVFGVVFMIAGLWWKAPLMKLLGSTPTILPYAITYSTYIFIASPFMCTSFVLNNLLRAEGKAKLAMIGILSGGVLNVFLAPVLIFGCSLGIAGAGISTAVGQGISCGILLYWFLAKKTTIAFSLGKLAKRPKTYIEILKNGIPSFFRQGLASVATVLVNQEAAEYSDAVVAGMSIVNRIFLFLFSIAIGFVQGYNPVVGYNYGASNDNELKNIFKKSMSFIVVAGVALTIVAYALSGPLSTVFVGYDEKLLELTKHAFKLYAFSFLFCGFGIFIFLSILFGERKFCEVKVSRKFRPKVARFSGPIKIFDFANG